MESDALTQLGPDELVPADEGFVIRSPADMPWSVREFCRTPIWYQDKKYYLHRKQFDEDRRCFVYDLRHWPSDHAQASSEEIFYDLAYIEERDRESDHNRKRDRWSLLLRPFYPLLGYAWSDYKNRVLVPMGFRPDSITRLSVFVSFNIAFVTGIFVGWLRQGEPIVMWSIMIVFGLDCAVRFTQSLHFDVEGHWGFLEWLLPSRWRK